MAVQPGHRIPETLLAAANLILRTNEMASRREQEVAENQLRFQSQVELLKYREEVLGLKEEALKLQGQRETRLALGQEEKLKQGARSLSIKEETLKIKAGGAGALQGLRQRRLQLQLLEDEAALRPGADPNLQMFSDTKRLISEKNRIESLINQRISSFAAEESSPEIKAMREGLNVIGRELLERGKYKRDVLLQAGLPATLDIAKQHLPDMPDTEEEMSATQGANAIQPGTAPVPPSDVSLDRAVKGALGQNPEYSPEAALSGFKTEMQRLKGLDPSGGKTKAFRHDIFKQLKLGGMSDNDAVQQIQNWGL